MRRYWLGLSICFGIAMLFSGWYLQARAEPSATSIVGVVHIVDFGFEPQYTRISQGDSVLWQNIGQETHAVVATDRSWSAGTVAPNQAAIREFPVPGIFNYFCDLHLNMSGVIEVQEITAKPTEGPTEGPTEATGPGVGYLPYAEQAPTPVPATATPEPTATALPTSTPTGPVPTATPAPPPPSYNNCTADPYAGSAPNFPIRIVTVNKSAETVTIRNLATTTVLLDGWRICSITGNQSHAVLSGSILPGETRVIASEAGAPIWNNASEDDATLYNQNGQLISYWNDPN